MVYPERAQKGAGRLLSGLYASGYVCIPLKSIQLYIEYTKTSKSEFSELFGVKKWGLLNLVKFVLKYAKIKVWNSGENGERERKCFCVVDS